MAEKPATRFGLLSIGLHWLMFFLLVLVYATMELREIFPKGSDPREAMKIGHYMLGLSIFVLVWIRLVARLISASPAIVPKPPAWQTHSARAIHAALYVVMIAMPLLGWLLLSAEGKQIPFFGLQLPALINENEAFAEQIEEIHELIGTAGYFLIGVHTVAALFHHYMLRDNTLQRMSPFND